MYNEVVIAFTSWSGGISFTLTFLFVLMWWLQVGITRSAALALVAIFGFITLGLGLANVDRLFLGWWA